MVGGYILWIRLRRWKFTRRVSQSLVSAFHFIPSSLLHFPPDASVVSVYELSICHGVVGFDSGDPV